MTDSCDSQATRRKFVALKGGKVGTARQAREAVATVLRAASSPKSDILVPRNCVEPLDYENFVASNRKDLESDPACDIILLPYSDIEEIVESSNTFVENGGVNNALIGEASSSLLARQCIKTYTSKNSRVRFKYSDYGVTFKPLLVKTKEEDHLCLLDYEIDSYDERIIKPDSSSDFQSPSAIKEGYISILRCSSVDDCNITTLKNFKKRFCSLRANLDKTYRLEFHKDQNKVSNAVAPKLTIYLDLCTDVVKSFKKGRCYLDLKLTNDIGRQNHVFLSCESERVLDEWYLTLRKLVESVEKRMPEKGDEHGAGESCQIGPTICATQELTTSNECLKPPDYKKFLTESFKTLLNEAKSRRKNMFSFYDNLEPLYLKGDDKDIFYSENVRLFSRPCGVRFLVECKEINIKLPLMNESDSKSQPQTTAQIEPLFLSAFLLDAKLGKRVSETFYFDINPSGLKMGLVQRNFSPSPSATSSGLKASFVNGHNDKTLSNEDIPVISKALFSIEQPSSEVYLILHVDKMLQCSVQSGQEPYMKRDPKLTTKVVKAIPNAFKSLGHHRMPFAWSAKLVFQQFIGGTESAKDTLPLYRQDCEKLCDEELLKLLSGLKRPEKTAKLQIIPEVSITVTVDVTVKADSLKDCLTSSYVPISSNSGDAAPCQESKLIREVDSFLSEIPIEDSAKKWHDICPFTHYRNTLYIYPQSLKYDTQRIFSKARNLSCIVEFRESDCFSASRPLKRIYGRSGFDSSRFVSRCNLAVCHHMTNPQFYDQIKIELPAALCEQHHLLFTFIHVSLETALNSTRKNSNKKDMVETCVGYAWLPLCKAGRFIVPNEICLPVAVNLPDGYLAYESLGFNKGHAGPDIKWVDGGKSLFKLTTNLCSTVLSRDSHLQSFFVACQRLIDQGTLSDALSGVHIKDSESYKTSSASNGSPDAALLMFHTNGHAFQSLLEIQPETLITFLPTVFNQIFEILAVVNVPELLKEAIRAIYYLVEVLSKMDRGDLLKSYVKHIYSPNNTVPIYHYIMKCLSELFEDLNDIDKEFSGLLLKHLWFLLELSLKDMCLLMIRNNGLSTTRANRFPAEFSAVLEKFVQACVRSICRQYKTHRIECELASQYLAHFLKTCFNVLDRGLILRLSGLALSTFDNVGSNVLKEFRVDFISILCRHEYFVQMNLPVMLTSDDKLRQYFGSRLVLNVSSLYTNNLKSSNHFRSPGLLQRLFGIFSSNAQLSNDHNAKSPCNPQAVLNAAEIAHEFRLSDEFCRHHFLIGQLLKMLKENLYESKNLRRKSILVLRNILAKHSFDDRYDAERMQRVIAMYFPLVDCLVASIPYIEISGSNKTDATFTDHSATGSVSLCSKDRVSKRSTALSDLFGSSRSSINVENALQNLSGSGSHTKQPSWSSEEQKVLDASSVETKQSFPSINTESTLRAYSYQEAPSSLQYSSSHTSTQPEKQVLHVLPYSKFDPTEISDLLLCFLFILKHAHEDILTHYWQQCVDEELNGFLRLIELTLERFKYRGKRCIQLQNSEKSYAPKRRIKFSLTKSSMTDNDEPKKALRDRSKITVDDYAVHETTKSIHHARSSLPLDVPYLVLHEAYLAQEVAFCVLNSLNLFAFTQKNYLTQPHKTSMDLLSRIYSIYLGMLKKHSSTEVIQLVMASLKFFVQSHIKLFLVDSLSMCIDLCRKLLSCCSWSSFIVQKEACSFLYLLMRADYENSTRRNFSRIHQHIIISLSQLLGNGPNLNNAVFNRALSIISEFASAEKSDCNFVSEVKELVRRQRAVLMATSQLNDHSDDTDMLAELQYSLAESYAQSPVLRQTWLLNLARHHKKYNYWAEAAQCFLRVIAFIWNHLKKAGKISWSVEEHLIFAFDQDTQRIDFDAISASDDQCTEDSLVNQVNELVRCTLNAQRYEDLSNIFNLIIPIHQKRLAYEDLSRVYGILQDAYSRLDIILKGGHRILGTYFRIILYNQALFEQQHNVEYVYRENGLVSLAEMTEKLKKYYAIKFNASKVNIVTDSFSAFTEDSQDSHDIHIQVTHLMPCLNDNDVFACSNQQDARLHSSLRTFMFEVPFTIASCSSDTVSSSSEKLTIANQCKRRIILTTEHSFPYVLRRSRVINRLVRELNPLETAMDELRSRIYNLKRVCQMQPVDLKYLQLILQGSVLPTVNAGPLAYAEAFCQKEQVEKFGLNQWDSLKALFKEFVLACYEALEVNERFISPERAEYQQSLVSNFKTLVHRLEILFNDTMLTKPLNINGDEQYQYDVTDSIEKERCSTTVFNFIGGVH